MGEGLAQEVVLTHGTQVVEVNVKYLPSCLNTRPESLQSTTHNMVEAFIKDLSTALSKMIQTNCREIEEAKLRGGKEQALQMCIDT